MHAAGRIGLAAHWAYKQDAVRPDTQVRWIRDLVEILDTCRRAPRSCSNIPAWRCTRTASSPSRPKGELIQLPKGATPIDFAYAVHTDLGDQAVGAKINGRVVPLRTAIENGDQVQILRSKAQEPQPNWLNFAITGKARAAIRRHLRHKEREETQSRSAARSMTRSSSACPRRSAPTRSRHALKRLKLADEAALMEAIARRTRYRRRGDGGADARLGRRRVGISELPPQTERDLDQGADAGRRLRARRMLPSRCPATASSACGGRTRGSRSTRSTARSSTDGDDADWVDLAWGDKTEGGTARIAVEVKNEPGALGVDRDDHRRAARPISSTCGSTTATPASTPTRSTSKCTTLHHLMRLLAALRAADAVSRAERA